MMVVEEENVSCVLLLKTFYSERTKRKDYSTTDTNSYGHSDPAPPSVVNCSGLSGCYFVFVCVLIELSTGTDTR